MTASSISLLPSLEPMLGIVLALNLAYIALPRFRYRDTIRQTAIDKLKDIQDPPEDIKNTDWHKGVSRLCLMPNNSNGNEIKSAKLPDERWAATYKWLFEKHLDRNFAIGISVIAATLMTIGSAHSFGYMDGDFGFLHISKAFQQNGIHYWYWLTVLGMLSPVFAVYKGQSVVLKACDWAEKIVADGQKTMQAAAQVAQAPPVNNKPTI